MGQNLIMNELTDSYGRKHSYLRISVTDRCNLRCTYCMPAGGIPWKENSEILNYEEIRRLAKLFTELGVTKIRLTGGEPTIRRNIEDLIGKLSELPGIETLAMTTNGLLLKDKALTYRECGLKALNVSLDTLKKERFIHITKRDNFEQAIDGIYSSISAGFSPLKLNVVVMKGINDDEILDFIDFVKDKPINLRFIELMPFKENNWDFSYFLPYAKIKEIIETKYKLIPIKGDASNVAKDFCIRGLLGTVSFITSMTESFCNTCNRIRLTADGKFKVCLFSNKEVDLKKAMRTGKTDLELTELILNALYNKPLEHKPMAELVREDNRRMIEIGG